MRRKEKRKSTNMGWSHFWSSTLVFLLLYWLFFSRHSAKVSFLRPKSTVYIHKQLIFKSILWWSEYSVVFCESKVRMQLQKSFYPIINIMPCQLMDESKNVYECNVYECVTILSFQNDILNNKKNCQPYILCSFIFLPNRAGVMLHISRVFKNKLLVVNL